MPVRNAMAKEERAGISIVKRPVQEEHQTDVIRRSAKVYSKNALESVVVHVYMHKVDELSLSKNFRMYAKFCETLKRMKPQCLRRTEDQR